MAVVVSPSDGKDGGLSQARYKALHSLKPTVCPWKTMVGRRSFFFLGLEKGLFSGASCFSFRRVAPAFFQVLYPIPWDSRWVMRLFGTEVHAGRGRARHFGEFWSLVQFWKLSLFPTNWGAVAVSEWFFFPTEMSCWELLSGPIS